jgi:ParB family chromosome partitioning protein
MQTIQNLSIQNSIYRDVPLAQLQESSFNPRKRFEQSSLEELAQSIRAQGILAPLLVRELEPAQTEKLPAVPSPEIGYRCASISQARWLLHGNQR